MNAAASDSPDTQTSPTIMVVEDVLLVRMVVADQLRSRGYIVLEAASADEAIRILQANVPVDLVFSDVHMPESLVDGVELAQWIAARRPGLPVLLTSGVPRTFEATAHVLAKPYKLDELDRRIRELLS